MAHDPYDHGMKEVQCSNCAGHREVVQPVTVWNNQTKEYEVIERAATCTACGGTGKEWI